MDCKKTVFCILFLGIVFQWSFSQNNVSSFLKPSDSLNLKRKNTVILTEAIVSATALIGLNQLWYADYPHSKFHFINDNDEWLQMDKLGHLYSSYQLGRFSAELLNWSGATKKQQLLYGAGLGFAFLTTVEVMDGYSKQWGASIGDVIANASGTALYVSQELIWKEQRIIPKFSFRTTSYAKYRPNVLGSSLNEQILKDYNGQTYWYSMNLHSFFKESKIPVWLNLAVGYGADGMITGKGEKLDDFTVNNFKRNRQFYVSFDIDMTKIRTNSHLLKTFFSIFNTLKVPAPTLEFTVNKGVKGCLVCF